MEFSKSLGFCKNQLMEERRQEEIPAFKFSINLNQRRLYEIQNV
jgi:hypothetical protein